MVQKSRCFLVNAQSLPWARSKSLLCPGLIQTQRPLLQSFSSKAESHESEYAAAREWLKKFNAVDSLRDIGEVSYSRSSGPGGQNVNKVNSKAQLRVPVARLLPLIPPILHQGILASRYYAESSSSLVVQADESRKQQANKETCFRKLAQLIMDEYKRAVPGETTDVQKKKVEGLQKAENEARLKKKKLHSSKKQSRSKSNMD
ncbi:hypothetical protein HRR83_007832 [Exophiala dermatitidis]|uniref:Prokaryotic-type class I peptide chain release factors domain-containing protein n=2 Tax=Exophiala dermatitidis TaxID=5970 RepID=H6BU41_EXODN|nr:uncharacterized protein HMPREF1120_03748 [Exophiala dermatitidis NIH/UT8656]KAJ4508920.1 hypothetical protein HRR74_007512 [Exophiala dermatitidis]EHY55618.1 hypothetical protein HMPREF1120_03748 [Exophiala dermatitidis NIH/UT8656]KAJ4510172.1 hypothetical protein HRR73_006970 [Exophiala dermatitidis]KAJ4539178.1 hypothetical protein HRR77_006591 [Exophiala dermatitidis]KAJ4540543.1 hypothetical protein HRR76_003931 [Exophiala dermatitidis]